MAPSAKSAADWIEQPEQKVDQSASEQKTEPDTNNWMCREQGLEPVPGKDNFLISM